MILFLLMWLFGWLKFNIFHHTDVQNKYFPASFVKHEDVQHDFDLISIHWLAFHQS